MDETPDVAGAIREQVIGTAIDQLSAIEDPLERQGAAQAAIEAASALRGALARVRSAAVLELQERGKLSWPQVGALLGTSGPRAHQVAHGRRK